MRSLSKIFRHPRHEWPSYSIFHEKESGAGDQRAGFVQKKELKKQWCTLGLGSNLGNPLENLHQALDLLQRRFASWAHRSSSFYVTPPLSGSQGGRYVNAVYQMYTDINRFEILDALQAIEWDLGRRRDPNRRWAARPMDIDLLFYGCLKESSKRLILPHPEVLTRPFTMLPLYEIDPDAEIPQGTQEFLLAVMRSLEEEITRLVPEARDLDGQDFSWDKKALYAELAVRIKRMGSPR